MVKPLLYLQGKFTAHCFASSFCFCSSSLFGDGKQWPNYPRRCCMGVTRGGKMWSFPSKNLWRGLFIHSRKCDSFHFVNFLSLSIYEEFIKIKFFLLADTTTERCDWAGLSPVFIHLHSGVFRIWSSESRHQKVSFVILLSFHSVFTTSDGNFLIAGR